MGTELLLSEIVDRELQFGYNLDVRAITLPKWRNGRRAWFRTMCPQGRVGSTPTFGTISVQKSGFEQSETALPNRDKLVS
jgi:hypothetical protein